MKGRWQLFPFHLDSHSTCGNNMKEQKNGTDKRKVYDTKAGFIIRGNKTLEEVVRGV